MRTLDLNLATRPFRNNTLVWLGYVILLVAAVGFSYWNVSSYAHYERELVQLDDIQGNREQEQADLQQRHRQLLQAVKRFDVKSIGRRTSKANQVIEWKAFSWTRLFNRLEEMLPYKVRMTSVRPIFRERDRDVQDGELRHSISVAVEGLARDLSAFHEIQTKLIDHDSFGHVEPRYVDKTDNGEYSFAVNFLYYPGEEPEGVEESDLEAEPEVAANEPAAAPPAETSPAPAAQRKLPPADPKPAEVTDDWAESADSEETKPKPRRRSLPRVDPEEPDTAAPGEQGSPR